MNRRPSASTESRAARLGDKGKRRMGQKGCSIIFSRLFLPGCSRCNRDGTIVRLNQRAAKMFGYQPDEPIGQQIEVLVPERFREEHVQHRRSFFSKLRPREVSATPPLAARRKDGSEFPVESTLFPLKFEQEQVVIATVHDIAYRVQAEESLRSREEHFRALIECGTIRRRKPDILVLDIQMPKRSGFEELKAVENGDLVPTVIMPPQPV